ncbi:MAG: hypothetical protein JNK82_21215, partial [Myxococcaceae bacterium]|nr:hypothetical protein [Myxococcaceae bacterium]
KAALGNATPEEVNERLTYAAFARNVGTGLMTGLLLPDVHMADDLTLLTRPGTSLAGPVYAVRQLDGEPRLFAPVRVNDDAGRVLRTEFLEVDANNPKVKQALERRPATVETQANVDAALADSRFKNRYTEQGRKELIAKANDFAVKRTLADAEVVPVKPQTGEVQAPLNPTEVTAVNGAKVDSVSTLEQRMKQYNPNTPTLTQLEVVAAFGNGPYADELAALLAQSGPFRQLAKTQPDVANYLYRAGSWTDVRNLVGANIKNGTLDVDALVKQVRALEPKSQQVGEYTVLENPVGSNRAAVEVILPQSRDRKGAFYQSMPIFDADSKYVTSVVSDLPVRNQPFADQIFGADGKPLGDLSRTALFRSHGNVDGFSGLDTQQAAELMADAIITSGREIDQVVLVSCLQGERRAFTWDTNGKEFQAAFREVMRKKGYDVQVRAASKGGVTYGRGNAEGQFYDGKGEQPITFKDPNEASLLRQGLKRDEKTALAVGAGLGTAAIAGGVATAYVIYSVTKTDEQQPKKP